MNTNETIEYEIPTEEELDVSVQGAERRGIRIGIEKMRDAVCSDNNPVLLLWDEQCQEVKRLASQLLAEQGKK